MVAMAFGMVIVEREVGLGYLCRGVGRFCSRYKPFANLLVGTVAEPTMLRGFTMHEATQGVSIHYVRTCNALPLPAGSRVRAVIRTSAKRNLRK